MTGQSGTFALPDHGWTVGLTAERADSVGCRLTQLEATRTAPLAEDDVALEAHARKAAGRVTGGAVLVSASPRRRTVPSPPCASGR